MNWYFSSGDLDFFWGEQLESLSWLPDVRHGLFTLWLDYPFRLLLKLLASVGFSWFFIEKLLWVSVFVLAVYSSYKLTKSLIGSLIYSTNTYFLLLFSGGQLGVAAAYALTPLVLVKFEQKNPITSGLWLALLIIFDLRIAYLIVGAIILYRRHFIVPLCIAASIHLYWILPTVFASSGVTSLGEQFTNPGMLKFLSFADFSHAISLLHPNWPENLFGKVYFLQPEFLIIPILAFAAMSKNTRYFSALALIGAFFAKGVNAPFGGIFEWLFTHIPGFIMFRDPTKFYVYVAIGYAVLIPVILKKSRLFSALFIIFWIFTLRGINVKPSQLPEEYVQLKNILVADPIPSRTLWIPRKENYAFFSDIHPILTATDSSSIDPSVKYVIVPIDVNRRIFLRDYKFDEMLRNSVVADISLPRDTRFYDLAVFKNPNFIQMNTEVTAITQKQQYLANIGVIISAVLLITFLCILVF